MDLALNRSQIRYSASSRQMEEGVTTAAPSLKEKNRKELEDSSKFLELNWLKQSEWHYNKIEESTRGIRDILRISKDPECKACRAAIRKAINEMHNEIESIRCVILAKRNYYGIFYIQQQLYTHMLYGYVTTYNNIVTHPK